MNFEQEVLDIIAEVCQEESVKETPDMDLFEEGLLDSFGTVEMLVEFEDRLGISSRSRSLTVTYGTRQMRSSSS